MVSLAVSFLRGCIDCIESLSLPFPNRPLRSLVRSSYTAKMPPTDTEKDKHQEAGHYEHAYLEDKTGYIASTPEVQDPSGPALAPGEKEDKTTRRLIRKIDIRLLPVLAVIYAFALIDRVNLPNARIAGMDEDLELSVGDRYSLVVMIFFVSVCVKASCPGCKRGRES